MGISIRGGDGTQGEVIGDGVAARRRKNWTTRRNGVKFQVFSFQQNGARTTSAPPADNPKLSAADTGTAHHKFLQQVALEDANDVAALESEANRLEQEKVLSADERAALDLEDVAAFWNSEPGRKIRAQAANVRRELAFTARFSPAELAAITGAKSAPGLEDEFVVVQGVADLVVLLPEEIWLADFKTDEIRRGRVAGQNSGSTRRN